MSIACRILGHHWYYLLSEVGYVPLQGWPQGTRCQRCGAPHPRPLPARARAELAEPVAERVTLPLPEHAPDEHLHLPSGLDRREVAAWYHGHGCGWQAARAVLAEQEADGPAVPEGREPAAISEQPRPAPPAEGEVAELIERLKYAKQNGCIPSGISWGLADGSTHHKSTFITAEHGSDCGRAAELLERHAAPAPQGGEVEP